MNGNDSHTQDAPRLILNYHDAILYDSDLKLLESPDSWWNDACLHFGLTHYQHHTTKADMRPRNYHAILDPSVVSFLMNQCCGDDEDGLEDFRRGNQQAIDSPCLLVPINDTFVSEGRNCNTTPGRVVLGTHWSLLLAVRMHDSATQEREYWHFDSVANSNSRAAQAVALKLSGILEAHDSSANITRRPRMVVTECRTPQQTNGYDCGVHTLVAARVVESSMVDHKSVSGSSSRRLTRERLEEALSSEFDAATSRTCQVVRRQIAQEARRLAEDYRAG